MTEHAPAQPTPTEPLVDVDAMQAELEELRAQRDAQATTAVPVRVTTRERSPKKPADYQPKPDHLVRFDFSGKSYELDARYARDIRTQTAFVNGHADQAITRMLGADGYDALVTSLEDEDGFSNLEELGEWLQTFMEAAGTKN